MITASAVDLVDWPAEVFLEYSGGGAFTDRSAAEVRALEGRGHVGGLVGRADVGAGWDDLVDPVEDLVGDRHFPQRSDLVKAVFQREVDACADAGPALAAAHEPGVALAKWLHRYTEFLANKRGLGAALHSGDPAFDALPGYFMERVGPTLGSLLEAATASGEIRADISPKDLLYAVANLCQPVPDGGVAYSQRMVALLIDGLRYGAESAG